VDPFSLSSSALAFRPSSSCACPYRSVSSPSNWPRREAERSPRDSKDTEDLPQDEQCERLVGLHAPWAWLGQDFLDAQTAIKKSEVL